VDLPAFGGQLEALTMARFAKSVVPIFGSTGDGMTAEGTGTLFQIADARFLVTATHVLEFMADHPDEQSLYTTDFGAGPPVPLLGHFAGRDQRPLDVAAVRLADETVASLPRRTFLRFSDVFLGSTPDEWPFFVHGYPVALLKRGVNGAPTAPTALTIPTSKYRGTTGHLGDSEPGIHLFLNLPDANLSDGVNMDVRMPELKGVSGCSIWAGLPTAATGTARFDAVKVVAVQTGVFHRAGAIKGTLWTGALMLIGQRWPDLRPAIDVNIAAATLAAVPWSLFDQPERA
jgi:hypothetical protein